MLHSHMSYGHLLLLRQFFWCYCCSHMLPQSCSSIFACFPCMHVVSLFSPFSIDYLRLFVNLWSDVCRVHFVIYICKAWDCCLFFLCNVVSTEWHAVVNISLLIVDCCYLSLEENYTWFKEEIYEYEFHKQVHEIELLFPSFTFLLDIEWMANKRSKSM